MLNIIFIFETSLLEFVLLQSLMQTTKSLNLESKMLYLGTLGLEFQTAISIFEINSLQFA